jgi:hypothetical protein
MLAALLVINGDAIPNFTEDSHGAPPAAANSPPWEKCD